MRKLWLATLTLMILGLMTVLAVGGSLAQNQPAAAGQTEAKLITSDMPAKLQKAINQSLADPKFAEKTKKAVAAGVAKRGPEPGFLGIAGAPAAHYVWGLLWAIWVGWIFSTVGAFGGIMAGVGHITIFGLGDYASSYSKGNPVNKLITDSIRVSNQWLVGLSALISSFNYYKMGRLVLPLGACLAIGGVAGSWLIPELTAGKVSLKAYIGYFGLLVFVLACFLIYEMTPKGQASKKAAKAAAAAFEKGAKEGDTGDKGVKILAGNQGLMWIALGCVVLSALWFNLYGKMMIVAYLLALAGLVLTFFMGTIRFTFFGVEFKFRAFIPMLGGLIIAAIASFLGVGGGFLFVPFLTSVAGLPMFLVAGTSALAVLVGMIVSIFSYMVGKGVPVSWGLIGAELVGIFIGSMIGPRTSKYIPEKGLKWIFIILAFYVGLRYTTKGFLGYSIVPPF